MAHSSTNMPANQNNMPQDTRRSSGKDEQASLEIAQMPSLQEADKAILVNLWMQLGISALCVLVFVLLRKKLPWLYYPNTKKNKKHPASGYTGAVNWLVPVLMLPDSTFFSLVGFDAFLFVETLRLLFFLFLVFSLLLFPLLGWYYYYFGGQSKMQLLLKMSILSLPSEERSVNGLVPAAATWAATLLTMCFLYMFYRRYIIFRQLHLRDSSFSRSTPSIKKQAEEAKSLDCALEEIDLASRTVLVQGLPPSLRGKRDMIKYMEVLNADVKPVQCHVITNTKRLEQLVLQRTENINKLERLLQEFFLYLNRSSIENSYFMQNIQEYDTGVDLISNAITWSRNRDIKEKLKNLRGLSTEVTKQALSPEFLSLPYKLQGKAVPAEHPITRLLASVEVLNRLIETERAKSKKEAAEKPPERMQKDREVAARRQSYYLHDTYRLDREKPMFFSLRSLLYVRSAWRRLVESFPTRTKSGFITFRTAEEANLMKMSFIGTGTFSCRAVAAPAPENIIWPALTDSESSRMCRQFIGSIVTFLFTGMFMLFVFLVATLINLSTFNRIVLFINPALRQITDTDSFKQTFQSIIVPLLYSGCLSLAPLALNCICLFEGSISQVELQQKFGERYATFLFINEILALMFGTTIASLLSRGPEKGVLNMLSEPIVSSSIFFLNTLIQRTLSGILLNLLRPDKLAAWAVDFLLGGILTRREEMEAMEAGRIDFGYLYPRVFLMFPLIMIYTVICPIFMVFGALYFLGAFLVYKTLFLYSCVSEQESGGVHWPGLCSSIFYGLVTFQCITIIHFLSMGQYLVFFCLLPLVVITVSTWSSFRGLLEQRANYLPSNREELEESTKVLYQLLMRRRSEILEWVVTSAVEKNVLQLSGKESASSPRNEPNAYIYRDVSLMPSSSAAILPRWFYMTLLYLYTHGSLEKFGLAGLADFPGLAVLREEAE